MDWEAIAAAAIEASDEVQRLRGLFEVVQLVLANEDEVDAIAIIDMHVSCEPGYDVEQIRFDLSTNGPRGKLRPLEGGAPTPPELEVSENMVRAGWVQPAPTSSEREHADKCLRELLADEHDWSENFVDLILRERAAAAAQAKSGCENRIKELKSLLLKCSTTLSMLRPGMKLPSQNDWDRLEQLHNQIAFESGK